VELREKRSLEKPGYSSAWAVGPARPV